MANCALTKLICKFSGVVSLKGFSSTNARECVDRVSRELETLCKTYGLIVHDRDLLDDGTFKTLHIHVVGDLEKRKRVSTIINNLADWCGVSPLAVSVEQYTSFEACFQYLIHKNDKTKYQYSVEDIRTNLTDEERDLVLTSTAKAIDFAEIKSLCYSCENLLDLIEHVGMSVYQHYRATILDMFQCVKEMKRLESVPRYDG